jgi:hypothetical protein
MSKSVTLKYLLKNSMEISKLRKSILEDCVGLIKDEDNFYIAHASQEEELEIEIACNHLSIAENMIQKLCNKAYKELKKK